jgi:hypothetical protein
MERLAQACNNIENREKERCHHTFEKFFSRVSCLSAIHFPIDGWRGCNLCSAPDRSYLSKWTLVEPHRLRNLQWTNNEWNSYLHYKCSRFHFTARGFWINENCLKSDIKVTNWCSNFSWSYSLFFNQRTTTPQFTSKIELTTLYTFDLEWKISSYKNWGY